MTGEEIVWTTWKFDGVAYLAVERDSGFGIIDQHGNNYGGWESVASFRKRQMNEGTPEVLGKVRVQLFSYS